MRRLQFYPDDALFNKLNQEAKEKGVSVSTLLIEILKNYYGLTPKGTLTDLQIEQRVFKEVEDFIKTVEKNTEWDLNTASKTYRNIEMVRAQKPHTLKATIGKRFTQAIKIADGPLSNIEQIFLPNGKPKKTPGNQGSLYKVKDCINFDIRDMYPNYTDEEIVDDINDKIANS